MNYPGLSQLYRNIIGKDISSQSIIFNMVSADEVCKILDTIEAESEINQEVILRCWNGESMADIADIMGVSRQWVTHIRLMICDKICEAING